MKYRRRSCLLKCIQCNREVTCIRQRSCLFEIDGGQV